MMASSSHRESPRKHSVGLTSAALPRSSSFENDVNGDGIPLGYAHLGSSSSRISPSSSSLASSGRWVWHPDPTSPGLDQPFTPADSTHERSLPFGAVPPPPPLHGPRRQFGSGSTGSSGPGAVPGVSSAPGHPVTVVVPPRSRASTGGGGVPLAEDKAVLPSTPDSLEMSNATRRGSQETRVAMLTPVPPPAPPIASGRFADATLGITGERTAVESMSSSQGLSPPHSAESSRRESLTNLAPAMMAANSASNSATPRTGKETNAGKALDSSHARVGVLSPPVGLSTSTSSSGAFPTPDSTPRTSTSKATATTTAAGADGEVRRGQSRTQAGNQAAHGLSPRSSSSSDSPSSRHVRFVDPNSAAHTAAEAGLGASLRSTRDPMERSLSGTAPGSAGVAPVGPSQNLVTLLVQTSADREPVRLAASIIKPVNPNLAMSSSMTATTANSHKPAATATAAAAAATTASYKPDAAPVRSALRPSSYTTPAAVSPPPAAPAKSSTSTRLVAAKDETARRSTPWRRKPSQPGSPSHGSAQEQARRRVRLALIFIGVTVFLWISSVIMT